MKLYSSFNPGGAFRTLCHICSLKLGKSHPEAIYGTALYFPQEIVQALVTGMPYFRKRVCCTASLLGKPTCSAMCALSFRNRVHQPFQRIGQTSLLQMKTQEQ
jgi:hypothetical protein